MEKRFFLACSGANSICNVEISKHLLNIDNISVLYEVEVFITVISFSLLNNYYRKNLTLPLLLSEMYIKTIALVFTFVWGICSYIHPI